MTATIAVAARRPRLRAVLENYLTQALKHGCKAVALAGHRPEAGSPGLGRAVRRTPRSPVNWALATGDSLVNWFADAAC